MNPTDHKPLGLIVCMPTRGAVSIETMLCLREHLGSYPNKLLTVFRKPVVEARNQLAKEARELDPNYLSFDPRYVLWVDDDAWWPAGHVDRAISILEANPDVSMVTGMFCTRNEYRRPTAVPLNGPLREVLTLCHEPGELIPLRLGSLHWALMRHSLLDLVGDEPFNQTEFPSMSSEARELLSSPLMPEDYSFFTRAIAKGAKIVTERGLRVAHVDVQNGAAYYPNVAAMIADGVNPPKYAPDKVIGDGDTRTYFGDKDGHDVWRIDLDQAAKAEAEAKLKAEAQAKVAAKAKPNHVLSFISKAVDSISVTGGDNSALRNSLNKLFKQETGVTPDEMLLQSRRLKIARQVQNDIDSLKPRRRTG